MFSPRIQAVTLAAAALATACTGGPELEGDSSGHLAGRIAMLTLERCFEIAANPRPTCSESVQAAFADYQGMDADSVAHLLGAELPGSAQGCSVVSERVAAIPRTQPGIDLLDLGHLQLQRGPLSDELWPRTFPEVGGVAAGVFYAGDLTPVSEPSYYAFVADGSADAAGFRVSVQAPADVAALTLDGQPARMVQQTSRDQSLQLRWQRGAPRDVVEVELRAAAGRLVCTQRDAGHLELPSAMLQALPPASTARLTIRRLRIQSFDAPGFDLAYVKLASALTTELVLQ